MRVFKLLVLCLFLFACKKEITKYHEIEFNKIFKLVQKNHVHSNKINWIKIKNVVKDSLGKIKSINDKYKAIDLTLRLTKDKHSFFLYPSYDSISKEYTSQFNSKNQIIPNIKTNVIDKEIIYLELKGFASNDSLSNLYSKKIYKTIDTLKKFNEWIIDLRNNSGGKQGMFPLGFSVFLNNSIINYSKDNRNNLIVNKISKGVFLRNEEKIDSIKTKDYKKLKNKIAILINENTKSSAEILAFSLRKNANAKLFGSKTAGLLSNINVYSLTSGASFGFSITILCDSLKNAILNLNPDFECEENKTFQTAKKWLVKNKK